MYMDIYNKPETVIIDVFKDKIKDIFYGIHENPIIWPSMKPIKTPSGYLNVTQELFFHTKKGALIIPGGYRADHTRTKLIHSAYKVLHGYTNNSYNSICNLIPNYPKNKPIYKEIVIEMEDGKKYHYSKWKTIKIINWQI